MISNRVRIGSGNNYDSINLTDPELWERGGLSASGTLAASTIRVRLISQIKIDTNKLLVQCNEDYKIYVYFHSSENYSYGNLVSSELNVQNTIIDAPVNTFLTIVLAFISNKSIYPEESADANVILNLL